MWQNVMCMSRNVAKCRLEIWEQAVIGYTQQKTEDRRNRFEALWDGAVFCTLAGSTPSTILRMVPLPQRGKSQRAERDLGFLFLISSVEGILGGGVWDEENG